MLKIQCAYNNLEKYDQTYRRQWHLESSVKVVPHSHYCSAVPHWFPAFAHKKGGWHLSCRRTKTVIKELIYELKLTFVDKLSTSESLSTRQTFRESPSLSSSSCPAMRDRKRLCSTSQTCCAPCLLANAASMPPLDVRVRTSSPACSCRH